MFNYGAIIAEVRASGTGLTLAYVPPGHCLGALDPVENYNLLVGCPLPRRKCLGALALPNTKHTGVQA